MFAPSDCILPTLTSVALKGTGIKDACVCATGSAPMITEDLSKKVMTRTFSVDARGGLSYSFFIEVGAANKSNCNR
jgi:hypothetical protein